MLAMAKGDIGRRVRTARETLSPGRLRIIDLANEIGISHARLSGWERGKHDPPKELLPEIARILRTSTRYLLTGSQMDQARETSAPYYPVSYSPVEIAYGGYVPAGNWADPFETENLIEVEAKFDGPGRFACKVEGDSMYPFLMPEDIVVFQELRSRRAVAGQIIIARRKSDNGVTVKLLSHDGERFRLSAINPRYNDDGDPEWEAIGFLVGIERRRGRRIRTDYDPDGLRNDEFMG